MAHLVSFWVFTALGWCLWDGLKATCSLWWRSMSQCSSVAQWCDFQRNERYQYDDRNKNKEYPSFKSRNVAESYLTWLCPGGFFQIRVTWVRIIINKHKNCSTFDLESKWPLCYHAVAHTHSYTASVFTFLVLSETQTAIENYMRCFTFTATAAQKCFGL